MAKRWVYQTKNKKNVEKLSVELGVSHQVAGILTSRGIHDVNAANIYFHGTIKDLSSPFALLNMSQAIEEILDAIKKQEKIIVYGDYDVDGICSSVLLKETILSLKGKAEIYIPSRMSEGYGVNKEALRNLIEEGAALLITVDNGISAGEILNPFIELGLKVIVTDHHQIPDDLANCTIINPLLEPDETAPYRTLCGCGVAFMLAWGLMEKANGRPITEDELAASFELAAIATVADIVPLIGDNRLIVKQGLKILRECPRIGLRALAETSGINLSNLSSDGISFQIAPRINAAGRLDRVILALKLLQSKTPEEAEYYALELNALNEERKEIENKIFLEAIEQIGNSRPKSIIVYGNEWHPGVIGIVASRLAEKYGVPTIVLSKKKEQPNVFTGSGRAPDGFNLYKAVEFAKNELIQYGGHAKAAGLTIELQHIESFSKKFEEYCLATWKEWYGQSHLLIDTSLTIQDIDMNLYEMIEKFEPTGCGNPKPRFSLEMISKVDMKTCGKNQEHLQVSIQEDNKYLHGIGFRLGDYNQLKNIERHDILFHLNKQTYRGQEQLELIVEDIKPSYLGDQTYDEELFFCGIDYLEDDGYFGIEDAPFFHTKICGVTFDRRQNAIANLAQGDELRLIREYDNEFDSNAIAVWSTQEKIGYLKKTLARHLAPMLDHGINYEVHVENITGIEFDSLGVNVSLNRLVNEADIEGWSVLKRQKSISAPEIACFWLDQSPLHDIQEKTFHILDQGKNVLTIMGTGRGKSIIYQAHAAAVAIQHKKMTIVFFPLRALLNDQYLSMIERFSALKLNVIRAFGEMNQQERAAFWRSYCNHEIDVILTTPEFFIHHQDEFYKNNLDIGFFVLDEAHHLCEHREAYQQLSDTLRRYSKAQIFALTATVPNNGFEDILSALDIDAVYIDEYERKNLKIIDRRSEKQKNKYLLFLSRKREKTIVYVNSKRQAFEISKKLRSYLPNYLRNTISYYHAGLPKHLREAVANKFKNGQVKFLIATTAFGEGINIPDVKHVVIYHLCFSVEAFHQLSGRAGRNQDEAYIHLLYGERDKAINEKILNQSAPTRDELGQIYKFLKQSIVRGESFKADFAEWEKLLQQKYAVVMTQAILKRAFQIFLELNFIQCVEKNGKREYILVNQPIRTSLESSVIYMNGMIERSNYTEYLKLALAPQVDSLLEVIRKPVVPENIRRFGGGYYG